MIDKPLYSVPPTDQDAPSPEELNIEVVLDGVIEDLGGLDAMPPLEFNDNLTSLIDPTTLTKIAQDLSHDVDQDLQSRNDWERSLKDGLDLLGLKMEERTEPWDGACGVYHPILTEAAIRFQSEMISETFPAMGPVKANIRGEQTRQMEQYATLVVDDMNYRLTEQMTEFRPEHERMLWSLALMGSAFKKVYFDPSLDRQTSVFVAADDLLVPYGASDLHTSPRVTHRLRKYKNELRKMQVSGFYDDFDIGEPARLSQNDFKDKVDTVEGYSSANDDRFTLYETCCYLHIPDDPHSDQNEIELPYVVTILKDSDKILSIRRNWRESDPAKLPRQHFVHYIYIPGFGFYGLGLLHLLGNFASASTSLLRQLVDAGTLSNLPGGLKTNGLRIKGEDTPIAPGEWRDVDVASGTVRDNIMPLPYKEPSIVLAQLLDKIVEEGRRLASTIDVKLNEMNGEMPVGTTLAILERTLKVMSAIQARNHVSMSQEFKLLHGLIRETLDPQTQHELLEGYASIDIVPVSDPNASTMAQRIIQYQSAIQLAQQAPQVYNLPLLHLEMLRVMGIRNADKIIQTDDALVPTDPVSENMLLIKGDPAKAFIEQNHEAHIAVHQAFMQDPMTAAMMQNNPQAQMVMQAFQAHLMEHFGFMYRQQLEQQMGMMLPPPGQPLPPQQEQLIAPLLVQAAQQLNQLHSAQAQQTQAQQQVQDPLYQQNMMELQLKKQEIDNKYQVEMAKIETQLKIAEMKETSAHQMKAADIIERTHNAGTTDEMDHGPSNHA